MKKFLEQDYLLIGEILSVILFFSFSILIFTSVVKPNDANHYIFWGLILTFFGILQGLALTLRYDLSLLRICMAWFAGATWTWLSFVALNIIALPMFILGMLNMYSFFYLTNHSTINWSMIKNENSNSTI